MDKLSDIIKKIKPLERVQRESYAYDMNEELQIINAIGKNITSYFIIDSSNEFVYKNLIKYFLGDNTIKCINPVDNTLTTGDINKGIYIGGNPGSGKSLCMEIFNQYTRLRGIQYTKGIKTLPFTFTNFRADDIVDDFCKTGSFDRYKNRYVLSIQDFGAESTESYYMGNKNNVLKKIIEYRGDLSNVFTFITSNLQIQGRKLLDLYGDRVQSRLHAMCNYYTIIGPDRRK